MPQTFRTEQAKRSSVTTLVRPTEKLQDSICTTLFQRRMLASKECIHAFSSDAYYAEFNNQYLENPDMDINAQDVLLNVTHRRYYLCHRVGTTGQPYLPPYTFDTQSGVEEHRFLLKADDLVPYHAQQALLYAISNKPRRVVNMLRSIEQQKRLSEMRTHKLLDMYRQAITYRTMDEVQNDLSLTNIQHKDTEREIQQLRRVYMYLGYDCLYFCARTTLFDASENIHTPSVTMSTRDKHNVLKTDAICLHAVLRYKQYERERQIAQEEADAAISPVAMSMFVAAIILMFLGAIMHMGRIVDAVQYYANSVRESTYDSYRCFQQQKKIRNIRQRHAQKKSRKHTVNNSKYAR